MVPHFVAFIPYELTIFSLSSVHKPTLSRSRDYSSHDDDIQHDPTANHLFEKVPRNKFFFPAFHMQAEAGEATAGAQCVGEPRSNITLGVLGRGL